MNFRKDENVIMITTRNLSANGRSLLTTKIEAKSMINQAQTLY